MTSSPGSLPILMYHKISEGIDIKGTDSFKTFKTKLSRGRRNPFA